MILINVYFRELNHNYDFKADEEARLNDVIEEMTAMIAQKEHFRIDKNSGLFLLCKPDDGEILNPAATLAENGICSGDTLLLI